MSETLVAPLGGQLDLLVQWLEPILARPGLVREPAFQIVVGEAADDSGRSSSSRSTRSSGRCRSHARASSRGVIPVEPFLAPARADRRATATTRRASFSRARTARTAYEPIEAVASEAVYIDTLTLV